jgi:hypothetical protein
MFPLGWVEKKIVADDLRPTKWLASDDSTASEKKEAGKGEQAGKDWVLRKRT